MASQPALWSGPVLACGCIMQCSAPEPQYLCVGIGKDGIGAEGHMRKVYSPSLNPFQKIEGM